MAEASGVTLVLDVHRLPTLPGAELLAQQGNRNRANRSNREFAQAHLRIEGQVDEVRAEFLFDPQTSGGLLISVPAARAAALVDGARQQGAAAACIVGSVQERQDVQIVIRP